MRNNKGFSLIEVMTTLVLGLVVMLMVVQLFINAKNNHAQNDRITETLESGRYALRQIATDLQQAGYTGGVIDSSLVNIDTTTLSAPTKDCGTTSETKWAYDLTKYHSVQYDNAPTGNTNHQCVPTTFLSGTDILTVKRVSTNLLPISANNVYMRSDYNTACLWYYDGTNAPGAGCPTVGTTDWQYLVRVYYIRNKNGIPTLCRESLGAGPTMSELCLAEGIEKFHIMFGIDTDATPDGIANQFLSDPATSLGTTDWSSKVVSARIYVLARAKAQDKTFTNNKTYTMGDLTYTPNDKYYRRLYSTTVMLRNPTYASAFN